MGDFMRKNNNSAVKLCSTCVLNINSSDIPSENNRCVHCKNFSDYKSNMKCKAKIMKKTLENQIKEIKKTAKNRKYDCLVMLSGGKDSTMALYLMKKKYNLRVLAFTQDNGMIPQQAFNNMKNACDILEIDWVIYKPAFMKKVYRWILIHKVKQSLCRYCGPIMFNSAPVYAKNNNIPLVIGGLTKGQSDRDPAKKALWVVNTTTLRKLFRDIPEIKHAGIIEEETKDFYKKHNIIFSSPWIGEIYNAKKNQEILSKKLKWKETPLSYPKHSTSCLLNLLQVILLRKYHGYTLYDCEEATLINFDETTRSQAIDTLDYDIDIPTVKSCLKNLDLSLKDVGLTEQELKKYSHFK